MRLNCVSAIALAAVMSGLAGCCSSDCRGPSGAITVKSPDGRNEIRLYEGPLRIEALRDGVTLVAPTRIGLKVNGQSLAKDGRALKVLDRSGSGRVAPPVYKKASVDLTRTEKFADFGNWGVGLVARNDGVAYRFETKMPGEITVDGERADLSVPAEAKALVYRTKKFGCEETVPRVQSAAEIATAAGEMVYLPLVYTKDGRTVAVTESDVCDYPCWYLEKGKSKSEEVKGGGTSVGFESVFPAWPKKIHRAGGPESLWDSKKACERRGRWEVVDEAETFLVKTPGTRTLPWRTFVLADAPSKLCESDIVYALARPAKGDFSWVRPGKVAWDWWNAFDNAPEGTPNGGCTTKTYERFIDFASRHGVEYVIFDEGWSAALNIWKFHPEVDVPHLVKYAADRKVGIILWMAWAQIVGDEERVAAEFAKLGVKGFKVDFMDRADAQVERFLWQFADACAKHRLVIDYHGAHRPTGMSRAYPNVLNYEGIHGLECLKFYGGEDMMANDVAAFFGRLTAGPMDYTPGAMDNYPVNAYPKKDKARGIDPYRNPGSTGTRCHQMAMMAMYEAPLQMLSDSPTKYEKNIESFRFMAATPVVWADTVALGGSFDSYAACARQAKDGSWYAAALNNTEARTIEFDTSFLGAGEWKAEVFRDGPESTRTPTTYVHETISVKAGSKQRVSLAPGGGFVMRLTK